MKKALFAISVLATAVVLAKGSTPKGWTDDFDQALTRAEAEKKYIVADFSGSDWCGWCKKLDKEVFDTDVFRKGAKDKYVLLMIDSPRDKALLSKKAKKQNPTLVKKYGIQGFPTVLILNEKGDIVARLGYSAGGPEAYLKQLEETIRDAPEVEKYIKPIERVLDRPERESQKVYVQLCEKAIEEARTMKVSPTMEGKKAKLIGRYERALERAKKDLELSEAE